MRPLLVAASLILTALVFVPGANAAECLGKPGQVAACHSVDRSGACASVGVGLQGAWTCVGPGGTYVCTSMNTVWWGYCPTDLITTTIQL